MNCDQVCRGGGESFGAQLGEVCETFRWRCWRSCGSVSVQLAREGMLRNFQKNSCLRGCLLNTCYVLGVLLDIKNMVACKPGRNPCPYQP